jgi:hypothetical protein
VSFLVFQLLFVSFAYPGPGLLGVRFNLYTAPAFLASGMNIFGMLILWLLFNEQYAGLEMELELEEKKEVELVEEGMKTPKNIEITPVDKERRSSKTAATDVSPEADGGADGVY